MSRPAVVLIEPDTDQRALLGRELTEDGHEIVLAASVEEGLRFARGVSAAVVMVPSTLPEVVDGSIFGDSTHTRGSLVIYGQPAESLAERDDVLLVTAEDEAARIRSLRLALLSHEIGVPVDTRGETLVGDLALSPVLDLLRTLGEAKARGLLVFEGGDVRIAEGTVLAARAGATHGRKAFCRLARRQSGPFRFLPEPPDPNADPGEDLDALIVAAIEEEMVGFPDPATRLRVEMGPDFFAGGFSPLEQEVLRHAQRGIDLASLLDALAAIDGAIVQAVFALAERGTLILEEPATGLRVVTDSTADLPAHVARAHGIEVMPLWIRFGSSNYRDGIDLSPHSFYELLEKRADHPTTEPPSDEDFAKVYTDLAGREVLSLHVSRRMSETLERARRGAHHASEQLDPGVRGETRFEVVDSEAVSLVLGFQAIFAARMAARGLGLDDIVRRLAAIRPRLQALFVVDTLEYLVRGGRIGRAQGWIGGLLGIKPILGLAEGEVAPVTRIRGGRAAQLKVVELLKERLPLERPVIAGIVHSNAPVWADRMRRRLETTLNLSELLVAEMGPVVGTHVGPGMVGVVAFQPSEEEAPLLFPLPAASY